jgi:hypothetical protein
VCSPISLLSNHIANLLDCLFPSVPLEIAKTLDPSVQELLGYSLTDYTLGYASPARMSDMPDPDLIKTHEAAPLGSE